jgi:hypothetical protein
VAKIVHADVVAITVGTAVRVRLGEELRRGLVIEDRGNIGPEGERVVRVRLDETGDPPVEFDIPVSWLEISPARQLQRRRAAGRQRKSA